MRCNFSTGRRPTGIYYYFCYNMARVRARPNVLSHHSSYLAPEVYQINTTILLSRARFTLSTLEYTIIIFIGR